MWGEFPGSKAVPRCMNHIKSFGCSSVATSEWPIAQYLVLPTRSKLCACRDPSHAAGSFLFFKTVGTSPMKQTMTWETQRVQPAECFQDVLVVFRGWVIRIGHSSGSRASS